MGCQLSVPVEQEDSFRPLPPIKGFESNTNGRLRKQDDVLSSRTSHTSTTSTIKSTANKVATGSTGSVCSSDQLSDLKTVGQTERLMSKMTKYALGDAGDSKSNNSNNAQQPPPPQINPSTGHLMPIEVMNRTSSSIFNQSITLDSSPNSGTEVQYAHWTLRGYHPDDPHKKNQDDFSINTKFDGGSTKTDALFAVYDGHGQEGDTCSNFAKKELPKYLMKYMKQQRVKRYKEQLNNNKDGTTKKLFDPSKWPLLHKTDLEAMCKKAYLDCNKAMHEDPKVLDHMSGTTATSVLFHGELVTICNVGDSRAVLGHRVKTDVMNSLNTADSPKDDGTNSRGAASVSVASRVYSTNVNEEEKEEEKTEDDDVTYDDVDSKNAYRPAKSDLWKYRNDALMAMPLTEDQTPFRIDERSRVIKNGGIVMTIDEKMMRNDPEVDCSVLNGSGSCSSLGEDDVNSAHGMVVDAGGSKNEEVTMGNSGGNGDFSSNVYVERRVEDPPRVWKRKVNEGSNNDGTDCHNYPGCSFTRSLGDKFTKSLNIGIISEPEMITRKLTSNDEFLVIASDGIFEFMSNQEVIDICSICDSPLMACEQIGRAAYDQWVFNNHNRTDDITIIVCFLKQQQKKQDGKNQQQQQQQHQHQQGTVETTDELLLELVKNKTVILPNEEEECPSSMTNGNNRNQYESTGDDDDYVLDYIDGVAECFSARSSLGAASAAASAKAIMEQLCIESDDEDDEFD